jgi:hypothetical protein
MKKFSETPIFQAFASKCWIVKFTLAWIGFDLIVSLNEMRAFKNSKTDSAVSLLTQRCHDTTEFDR